MLNALGRLLLCLCVLYTPLLLTAQTFGPFEGELTVRLVWGLDSQSNALARCRRAR